MEDIVFYESLKISEWKIKKFQSIYDSNFEEILEKFITYIEDKKYGEIDIKINLLI